MSLEYRILGFPLFAKIKDGLLENYSDHLISENLTFSLTAPQTSPINPLFSTHSSPLTTQ